MKQILVVENEGVWQIRLKKILEKEGYHVTVVASIPDVIEALLMGGKPSLVIVDASLSNSATNRDGCVIVEKMGAIPTVCISAYLDTEEVERLGLLGRFVDKNEFDKKRFLNVVKKSLSTKELKGKMYDEKMKYGIDIERARKVELLSRSILGAEILTAIFAFLAGILVALSTGEINIMGFGSGYFMGVGIYCGALSIELLLCLVFISYYYELGPRRRKYVKKE